MAFVSTGRRVPDDIRPVESVARTKGSEQGRRLQGVKLARDEAGIRTHQQPNAAQV